jgi:ribonuclease HI
MKKCIEIYTDGGSVPLGNKKYKGALSFVILEDNNELIRYSRLLRSEVATNSVAELTAAISALKWIDENHKHAVVIYLNSDSQYLITGMNEWLPNWINNNWKVSNGKPVAHVELWKILDEYNRNYNIKWQWVRGHKKNINYNVVVDELCNQELKSK